MSTTPGALKLFYWTCRAYESAILAWAPDKNIARELIVNEVNLNYPSPLTTPDVDINEIGEIAIPTAPASMLIETWG